MNLPADTHLAYIVGKEAWYWTPRPDPLPYITVAASAKGSGEGVAWEFTITEQELGGKMCTRVKMFDDSYAALTQIPAFFAALADCKPGTLDEVRAILVGLGAVDETARVNPYIRDDDPFFAGGMSHREDRIASQNDSE